MQYPKVLFVNCELHIKNVYFDYMVVLTVYRLIFSKQNKTKLPQDTPCAIYT